MGELEGFEIQSQFASKGNKREANISRILTRGLNLKLEAKTLDSGNGGESCEDSQIAEQHGVK
jgi:hypothetical protein